LPSTYGKSCGTTGVPSATSRVGLGMWTKLNLSTNLEQSLDRPVVDETGFNGWVADFVEWSDDTAQNDKPSLVTALKEPLGLTLEPTERPLDFIIIDSAERPMPN